MFSGNIRVNLDPFETQPDDELWRVLDAVGLKSVISGLEGKLGAAVVDNGGNFSLVRQQARWVPSWLFSTKDSVVLWVCAEAVGKGRAQRMWAQAWPTPGLCFEQNV